MMNLPLNFAAPLPPCPECSSRECGEVCRFTGRARIDRLRELERERQALRDMATPRLPSPRTAAARLAVKAKLRRRGVTVPTHATTRELCELSRQCARADRYADVMTRRDIAQRHIGRPDHDTGPTGERMQG